MFVPAITEIMAGAAGFLVPIHSINPNPGGHNMAPDPNDPEQIQAGTEVDPDAVTEPIPPPPSEPPYAGQGSVANQEAIGPRDAARGRGPSIHSGPFTGGLDPAGRQGQVVSPEDLAKERIYTGPTTPVTDLQVRRIGWGVFSGKTQMANSTDQAAAASFGAELAQTRANELGERVTLEIFNSRGEVVRARYFKPRAVPGLPSE